MQRPFAPKLRKIRLVVQTAEGVRYRFFLATLDVYPTGDLIVYVDALGEGWTVEGTMGESDLTDCNRRIGPPFRHLVVALKNRILGGTEYAYPR